MYEARISSDGTFDYIKLALCQVSIVLASRGRRFSLSPPFVSLRARITRPLFARAHACALEKEGNKIKEAKERRISKEWKRYCASGCNSEE